MGVAAKVRVLFVDHESRLSGGEQDLADLVASLDPDRVDVLAAVPEVGPLSRALSRSGATLHFVPISRRLRGLSRWRLARSPWSLVGAAWSFVGASISLAALIRRLRPDIVHTNSMKAHVLAAIPCRVLGVPLVWHVRDIMEESWLRSLLLRLAVLPKRVVCISEAAARPFRERPQVEPKVRVVYNGIHLGRFDRVEDNGWRERLGATNGSLLVGMVGQIAFWKGQDVFIKAAADLAAHHPTLRFAVVGECLFPENEGEFDESIRGRADELGLTDRLVWAGWVDGIEPLMAALDVVVHASRLPEPFGRVLVEAMAAGTPVVSTTLGAGPEIVTPDAGRLVPAGDPEALARAVSSILDDRELRRGMEAAARVAARRFDISVTATAVERVWKEVLA